MNSLKDMEVILRFNFCSGCLFIIKQITWPSASRAWDLLNGVKLSDGVFAAQLLQDHEQSSDRQKRVADDAFEEKDLGYPQYNSNHPFGGQNGVQDLSTQIMAQMLGLDIPGIEPSTSYYPGYQWWPRTSGQGESLTQLISQPISSPPIPAQLNDLDVEPPQVSVATQGVGWW